MTVGLFSDTYPPDINGVATATHTLATELEKQGNTVYVITTNFKGSNKVDQIGHVIRVPGIAIKMFYSYRFSGFFSRQAYEILKKIPFDVIHVQTEAGIGYFGRLFAKMEGIPLVYTYHTLYADFTYLIAKNNKGVDLILKKFVSAYSHRWGDSPDEFITTSDKTRDVLRTYGVKRYINVIPNGVDFSLFLRTPEKLERAKQLRHDLGLDGKKVLLIVGRIGQEKGMDYVVNCLAKYLASGGDKSVMLVIAGDGPYKGELEKIIAKDGVKDYVKLVGKVPHPDIPEYYFMADVLLSGSKSETQGLTINEAMASRCLVLIRHDYNFDRIVKEGTTGFFFRNSETFASQLAKIFSLSSTEKEAIRDKAQKVNADLYSVDKFGKEVTDVYRRAIRKCW